MAPAPRAGQNASRFRSASLERLIADFRRLPNELTVAERVFLATAQAVVLERAKMRAHELGSVMAKSAVDIKAGKQPGDIVYGGRAYNMGAEWGAIRYKQFQKWRGKGDDAGYFVWPAMREFRDKDMVKTMLKFIDESLDRTLRSHY